MSTSPNEAIEHAIRMAKEGKRDEARELLRQELKKDKSYVRGWAAMAQLAETRNEAIFCTKYVLRLRPESQWAIQYLRRLQEMSPEAWPASGLPVPTEAAPPSQAPPTTTAPVEAPPAPPLPEEPAAPAPIEPAAVPPAAAPHAEPPAQPPPAQEPAVAPPIEPTAVPSPEVPLAEETAAQPTPPPAERAPEAPPAEEPAEPAVAEVQEAAPPAADEWQALQPAPEPPPAVAPAGEAEEWVEAGVEPPPAPPPPVKAAAPAVEPAPVPAAEPTPLPVEAPSAAVKPLVPKGRPQRQTNWLLIAIGAVAILCVVCVIVVAATNVLGSVAPGLQLPIPGGRPAGQNLDGYDTTLERAIPVGGSDTATLNGLFEAHNWTFEGAAGQTVTINVNGRGDCDPRAKLLDPQGQVIAEDDDGGGGYNALITATLPATGTYTIRIDVFTTGTYDIYVQ